MPNGSCRLSAVSPHTFDHDDICSTQQAGEARWPTASRSGTWSPNSTTPPEIRTIPPLFRHQALKPIAPSHFYTNVTVPSGLTSSAPLPSGAAAADAFGLYVLRSVNGSTVSAM